MEITNRLRSYRNGVHGDFFLAVADKIESLENENTKLRAAISQAITALDTDKDIQDHKISFCHDGIQGRRFALRHCQAAISGE